MKLHPGNLYHIYNRGNNQQPIFYSRENYLFFLRKMRMHIYPNVQFLAYCLMPNHFHWLVYICNNDNKNKNSLNNDIGILLRSYAQAINKRHGRTGSLFQQKTKAIQLKTRTYALTCFHYIHQNPLKANLINKLGQWPFSSFPDYANIRQGSLIDKNFAFQYLDIAQKSFTTESLQAIDRQKIKHIF